MCSIQIINCESSVKININNREYGIVPSEVPVISKTDKEMFKKLNAPTLFSCSYPLKSEVETLSNSIKELKDAQDHSTRNKIFGWLKTALLATVVVGGVLGISGMIACAVALAGIYTGPVTPIVGVFCIGALTIVGGSFLACSIHQDFWKESMLTAEIPIQKQKIEENLSELVNFFTGDLSELHQSLQKKIQETQQALNGQRLLPLSAQLQNDINAKKQNYEMLQRKLNDAIAYYSKFNQQGL